MSNVVVELKTREKFGKVATSTIRKLGLVPVVVYDKNGNSFSGAFELVYAEKLISDYSFFTRLFDVKLSGKTYLCIAKDVQFHPVTDKPYHFDFKIVELKDEVIVDVPVVVTGREHSVGLKRGGNVFILKYNIKVKAAIGSVPNAIEVDVSDSVIGSKYYAMDLNIKNAKPLHNHLIVRVSGRQAKEEVAQTTGKPEVGVQQSATADATAKK